MKKIIDKIALDKIRFGVSGTTLVTLIASVVAAAWRAQGWTSQISRNTESSIEIRAEQSIMKQDLSEIKSDVSDIGGDVKAIAATQSIIIDLLKKNE